MKAKFCHHPHRLIPAAAAALVGVLLVTSSATATIIYNLGTLGGTDSYGGSVNHAGQVAGASWTTDNAARHAFRYDGTPGSGGVMRDMGTLGGLNSFSSAINDAGQVTGYSSRITGSEAPYHAFRYDGTPGSGGVMRDLGTLGGDHSNGFGINDAGQVVGFSQIIPFNLAQHAFRYDGTPGSGGVMRDLGTLGADHSAGYGINNAGQVAGFSGITDGAVHAFRYDGTPGSGGVMRDLGTIGGSFSGGIAINDAGQVTGSSDITGNAAYHAFRYDGTPGSGGIMRDLGTLGGTYSQGVTINNAGQVAGWSEVIGGDPDDPGRHAFLYIGTPGVDGQMIDLDGWLNANDPTEGAKWTLTYAAGLSNTGWITGTGLYDPDGPGGIGEADRAFLLDASSLVPEPSSIGLLLPLLPAVLLRRRRSLWRPNKFSLSRDEPCD